MPTAEQRFVSFPNKYGPYVDTVFQLVLNRFEEVLSDLTFAVVVDREGEYLN